MPWSSSCWSISTSTRSTLPVNRWSTPCRMPTGWAMMALVQAARRSMAERPSRISCVRRLAAVRASLSVASSVTPVPSRLEGVMPCSAASALICAEAPWTSTTRMLSERSTAMSTRMLAKFSSVTIAPSTLMMNVFSRNWGMYCRMPRRSVSFTLGQIRIQVRNGRRSGFGERRLEGLQAALVFLGRADGDADPFGQLVAAHRPHDHAQPLHFVEHPLAVADADQDEVGRGRDELQTQLAEGARVELEAARVYAAGSSPRARCRPAPPARRPGQWR